MRAEHEVSTGSIFKRQFRGIYVTEVTVTLLTFIVCAQIATLERALLLALLVGSLAVVIHTKWHLRSVSGS